MSHSKTLLPLLSNFRQCQGLLCSPVELLKHNSKDQHKEPTSFRWLYRKSGILIIHEVMAWRTIQKHSVLKPLFFSYNHNEITCERMRGTLLLYFLPKKGVLLCPFTCCLFLSLHVACRVGNQTARGIVGVSALAQSTPLLGLFSTLMDLPMALPLLCMFPRVCIGAACSGFGTKHRVIHWYNASVLNVCIGLAVWAQQTGLKVFSKVQHWAYNDCHRGEPLPKVMKEQHAITHYLNTLWHLLQMHSHSAAAKCVLQHSYKKNPTVYCTEDKHLQAMPCRTSLL